MTTKEKTKTEKSCGGGFCPNALHPKRCSLPRAAVALSGGR